MRRMVSLWLPLWPIERWQRARGGSGEDEPFALVEHDARGLRLYAVNPAATAQGLAAGMALADARGMVPDLATAPAEPEADATALDHLARWCNRYSPWVAIDRSHGDQPRGLWIDIAGCAHLFGGEAGLLQDLVARLARMGFTARIGLASTSGAAWAVARCSRSPAIAACIVPEGRIEAALAPLPVQGLRLAPEVLTMLGRLGLKKIGDLYSLPRTAIKRRFAESEPALAVLHRLDQALGRVEEQLKPLDLPPAFGVHRNLAEPILDLPVVERLLAMLLIELLPVLERSHLGIRGLTLTLWRVDGSIARLRVAASQPTRDLDHLLRLFAEQLATIDPGFGIDHMALQAHRAEPLPPEQRSWSQQTPTMPAQNGLSQLVDRLVNRFGAEQVIRREREASYVPERAEQQRSVLAPLPVEPGLPPSPQPPRPLHLFMPPKPVEVIAAVPDGPPLRFRWRRRVHDVSRAEGPERIAPEWWQNDRSGQEAARDYYRIEDTAGRRFWLYRAGSYDAGNDPPRWYLHGLFA